MKNSLQKQLIAAQNRVTVITKKIEAQKPKNIFDVATTFKKVLQIAKPTKEELSIINYVGKSPRLLFAKDTMVIALIAEVLNQGKTNNIWFPVFNISGSGFVFSDSDYYYSGDYTAVGAGLRFCDEKTSDFAAKTFPNEFKNLIVSKQITGK